MRDNGRIVYFHGIPGSADELTLFGTAVAERTRHFHVVQRLGGTDPAADAHFSEIATAIATRFGSEAVRLVGFSLGAAAALRVAALIGSRVTQIDLISPAAPLQLGSYLDKMAGAPVFTLAQSHPRLFALQCMAQSGLARIASGSLASVLFASALGADRDLLVQPAFRAGIAAVLRHSLGRNRQSYQREISLYVEDWSAILRNVTQPVAIDHGALDNWSPVEMAHDLAGHLPNCSRLTIHPGLSHYSTLLRVLESGDFG